LASLPAAAASVVGCGEAMATSGLLMGRGGKEEGKVRNVEEGFGSPRNFGVAPPMGTGRCGGIVQL